MKEEILLLNIPQKIENLKKEYKKQHGGISIKSTRTDDLLGLLKNLESPEYIMNDTDVSSLRSFKNFCEAFESGRDSSFYKSMSAILLELQNIINKYPPAPKPESKSALPTIQPKPVVKSESKPELKSPPKIPPQPDVKPASPPVIASPELTYSKQHPVILKKLGTIKSLYLSWQQAHEELQGKEFHSARLNNLLFPKEYRNVEMLRKNDPPPSLKKSDKETI